MPTSETNSNVIEPKGPAESGSEKNSVDPGQGASLSASEAESQGPAAVRSRWVNYETHELMQMISDLEDERRWARLREGVWLAILFHLALLSAITLLPRYVFKAPIVVDRTDSLRQHKDFTYLDSPYQPPKVTTKPVPTDHPLIDKQTMETMKREAPAPTKQPETAQQPVTQTPAQPEQTTTPPAATQAQTETPHPAAVPGRPNFAMNSLSQSDQLREAMKGAGRGSGQSSGSRSGGAMAQHPGAGSGGVEVLSDTQGVDFSNWLQRWHYETERTWDPLIPDEVNPPILKKGQVMIRFKVLPNGRLMEGSMVLEGRSGDVALDRAAWGALQGSNYSPLPKDFHGPYLELRALFMYNMRTQ